MRRSRSQLIPDTSSWVDYPAASVPLIDLLIALAAVRAGASLWTRDEDFERVAEVLPDLQLHP